MASAFSGHLVNSYNQGVVTQNSMSFNPSMHGTQQSTPFTMFNSQGSMAWQDISEATTNKIASLQAKLNQKLGPEYVSQRPGPGGGPKLTYAEGWKVINLANEVFGFNGWSSNVVSLTTDFVDFNEESRRYNIMVTAIVRVTLRDGVFHEDIGSGTIENTKSKGQGLDKCKKEAVTDGLKRTLRNFGNLLGNCLYDKSYTQEVVKIKVTPPKFDPSQLHRRAEFEERKPDITSISMTNKDFSISALTSCNALPRPLNTSGSSAPVVKQEPRGQSLPVKGQAAKPRPMPPPPPPQQVQNTADNMQSNVQRRVNFADSNSSVTSASAVPLDDLDDLFNGFSDDDAFLASVDLEDLGPPIYNEELGQPSREDTDLGAPLYYADTSESSIPVSANVTPQPAASDPMERQNTRQQTAGKSSRLEAIIAAQNSASFTAKPMDKMPGPSRVSIPPPNQAGGQQHARNPASVGTNENRDLAIGQQQGSGVSTHAKRSPTPIGGFHFPAGATANSNQNSSRGPTTIGMKRPLDALASYGAPNRGSRPGMGLQHATAGTEVAGNGRQVLGRLDNGDGGDIKRTRR